MVAHSRTPGCAAVGASQEFELQASVTCSIKAILVRLINIATCQVQLGHGPTKTQA